jgi:3-methyl-2-oxobutanoate hydroxymethyltransferase
MKRLTIPAIRQRKKDGVTAEPIVMLTAYTARQAQLLDEHCDLLLVGDSLGQVIYGLPSSVPVTLDMMAAHGAAVVRGSLSCGGGGRHAVRKLRGIAAAGLRKRCAPAQGNRLRGVKLEGGEAMAETVANSLPQRGIPVMGHVGLDPASGQRAGRLQRARPQRGRGQPRSSAMPWRSTDAGAFAIVIEGVVEPIAIDVTQGGGLPDHRHRRLGPVRRASAGHRRHARHVRARAALREAL